MALIVETSVVYGRQILRGIARYLKAHAGWSVFLDERELHMPPPDWLSQSVYETPWAGLRMHPWEEERNRIAQWVNSLPRPVGIMACNDVRGQHVLDACGHLGAHVPDEVAVVGVDNAETFCELCNPPLSSVVPNAEGIGFEAARLLDRLMDGSPRPRGAC